MTAYKNWYGSVFRKLHLDYHQPPWMTGVAAAVTPAVARQQARMIRDSGVEAVEVFVHDHYGHCFFLPAGVGLAHPGLEQDYVQHMLDALRAEGLRAMAYVNVYANAYLKEQHPDWVLRTPDGTRIGGGWLQVEGSYMCPSSPYLEEYFLPLLRQVVTRFDFDVIWLDGGVWLGDTLCACDYCRKGFRQATGLELPIGWPVPPGQPFEVVQWQLRQPPRTQRWSLSDSPHEDETWTAWYLWRLAQISAYLQAVTQAVREIKPWVSVIDNNSGRWEFPQVARQTDGSYRWLTAAELGVDALSCDPVPWGGNHEVILSRTGRFQATTGLPYDFMNERFHKWGEWQLRSTTDFMLEFATILAVGGRCFFADQPYPDGRLEPAVYERLQQAYQFVAQREPFVRDAQLVPDVAILASAPSQLFGPFGSGYNAGRAGYGPVGNECVASRTDRVEGAHLLLTELGVHCLLYDEPTLRAHLQEQTAVIVPEQCLLEDATIDALSAYVEQGGSLLVTGRSGWWDEVNRPRAHTRLYDLLGVRVLGTLPAPVNYLRWPSAVLAESNLPDVPVQCWGTAVHVELVEAETVADLLGPLPAVWRDGVVDEQHWQHYTTTGACPPGAEVAGPGITLRRLGRGRAVYMAVDPFAAYRHDGHHLMRLSLGYLLELVAPAANRRLSARKPLHVEISLQQRGSQWVVHLVNYLAQKRSTALVHNEEIVPVHDILVRVRTSQAPRRVVLQPGDVELVWEYADGLVLVRVPELRLHAMVVIE